MFNRLLAVAVLAGVLTGVATTAVQMLWAVPLIHAAELYETQQVRTGTGHEHSHSHDHDEAHGHGPAEESAWAPDDGWERTFWTLVTNVSLAIGVALVLSGMFLLRGSANALVGLQWGLIGFVSFTLAPSLGLPPELPGSAAAALEGRQAWWLLTAASTLVALVLVVNLRQGWGKLAALAIAALPHLVGAPQPEYHAAVVPAELQREFVGASLLSMLAFWLVVGISAGEFFKRIFRPASGQTNTTESTGALSS